VNEVSARAVLNPQLAAGIVQLQGSLETPQSTDDMFLYWDVRLQFMLHKQSAYYVMARQYKCR